MLLGESYHLDHHIISVRDKRNGVRAQFHETTTMRDKEMVLQENRPISEDKLGFSEISNTR